MAGASTSSASPGDGQFGGQQELSAGLQYSMPEAGMDQATLAAEGMAAVETPMHDLMAQLASLNAKS